MTVWDDFTEDDFQLFDKVSRSLRKRAAGLLEYDDLYQEAAMFALTHRVKYQDGTESYRWSMIRNHLSDLIRKEKAVREGYEVDDEVFYTPKMLKKLVPLIFDPSWMEQSQQYDTERKGTGGERSDPANAWAMVADVKRGWGKLRDSDKVLLYRTLAGPGEYAQVTREIAVESGATARQVQVQVRDALNRLARKLVA